MAACAHDFDFLQKSLYAGFLGGGLWLKKLDGHIVHMVKLCFVYLKQCEASVEQLAHLMSWLTEHAVSEAARI